MWVYYCAGLLASLYVLAYGDDDFLDDRCKDKPDGIYEPGCKAYLRCTGGRAHQEFCLGKEVFNEATLKCDDIGNVGPPCGLLVNCSGIPDGRYPDLGLDCTSFYTCNNGEFLGHNKCPGDTVFNPTTSMCDWPNNTPPPCGTSEE